MAWKKITMEEAENIPFEYDEAFIDQGIEASMPALEAAGVFGPERQKQRLASGEGFSVSYKNGKPFYSSEPNSKVNTEREDGEGIIGQLEKQT